MVLNLKKILHDFGMSNILYNVDSIDSNWFIYNVKQRSKDQFIQDWVCRCNESSKGITYRRFRNDIFSQHQCVMKGITIGMKLIREHVA
jgi:ribosomal protein L20